MGSSQSALKVLSPCLWLHRMRARTCTPDDSAFFPGTERSSSSKPCHTSSGVQLKHNQQSQFVLVIQVTVLG